jgi:hypothetical protein
MLLIRYTVDLLISSFALEQREINREATMYRKFPTFWLEMP